MSSSFCRHLAAGTAFRPELQGNATWLLATQVCFCSSWKDADNRRTFYSSRNCKPHLSCGWGCACGPRHCLTLENPRCPDDSMWPSQSPVRPSWSLGAPPTAQLNPLLWGWCPCLILGASVPFFPPATPLLR